MDCRCYRVGTWIVGVAVAAALGCGSDAEETAGGSGSGGNAETENGASTEGSSGQSSTGSETGAETQADPTTGGGGVGPAVCDNPVELTQPSGAPSGFVRCESGLIERVAALECEPVDVGACDQGEEEPACSTAADCGDNGVCESVGSGPGVFCQCRSTCQVDADCGEGAICGCSPLKAYPQCMPSTCASTADCGDTLCGFGRGDNGCETRYAGACTSDEDACRLVSDCPNEEACLPSNGDWRCAYDSCK